MITKQRLIALGSLAILIPLLGASTAVAIRLRYAGFDVPGEPLLGERFYAPWAALAWWHDWGAAGEYAHLFRQGLLLALVPVGVVGAALGFRWYQGDFGMKAAADMEPVDLGSVAALKKLGEVATVGDGVVIGKSGSDILRVQGDGHVLVAGPSGAGKGTGIVIPTLLEHHGSMLVHDPKNSLVRICGRHRATLGPTWTFDPTNRYCDHFNPLTAVRGGDLLHGDCEMIATLIATSGEASDPVWEHAAAGILTALLLVAFEHGNPTLAYTHDLMFQICANRYPVTSNAFAHQVFAAHKADHHKITSSVNFTLRARMKFMSDPVVREVTSASDFNPLDLFCSVYPTTVFVTVPPADRQRMEALTRVTMQTIMNGGLYRTTHVSDGREKIRDVMLLLDEFPTLRRLEFLETNIAECREFRIRCVLVAQDLDQIQSAYGEYQSVTSNCSTAIIFPGFSQGSLATIEEWGGTAVRTQRSRGRDLFRPMSVHTSEMETRAPALNVQELIVRGRDELLCFRHGCLPTYLEKVRYYQEPRWKALVDA